MDKAMYHLPVSTEYKDGVKWSIAKCASERSPVAGSEWSEGLASGPLPGVLPKVGNPCSGNDSAHASTVELVVSMQKHSLIRLIAYLETLTITQGRRTGQPCSRFPVAKGSFVGHSHPDVVEGALSVGRGNGKSPRCAPGSLRRHWTGRSCAACGGSRGQFRASQRLFLGMSWHSSAPSMGRD